MGSLASKSLTPQEQMRAYKREISRAIRELDRERRRLEQQLTRLGNEIKQDIRANNDKLARQKAKDYARTKNNINKFYTLRTHLQGVELQMQTLKSTDAMANAMKNATKAMSSMAKRLNLPQLSRIMQEFSEKSEQVASTQEIVGEGIESVLADDDEEEVEEEILRQLAAELSLENQNRMVAIPSAPVPGPAAEQVPVKQATPAGGGDAPTKPSSSSGEASSSSGNNNNKNDNDDQGNASHSTSDLRNRLDALRKK